MHTTPGTDLGNRTVTDPHPFTLDPDRGFTGVLLCSTTTGARRLLAGIRPDYARTLPAQSVLALLIGLVTNGHPPEPVLVLRAAREHGYLATEHAATQLGDWIIDTVRAAPAPEAGDAVRTEFLDAALRRAIAEHAHRLARAARQADLATLRDLIDDFHTDTDLWHHLDTTTPSEALCRNDNTHPSRNTGQAA